MTTRNVYKQLAAMEDLAQGVGIATQRRGNTDVTVGKVDVPYSVQSEAELQQLDVTKFTLGRIYSSLTEYEDYYYDPTATEGIAPGAGTGFWVRKDVFGQKLASYTDLRFQTVADAISGTVIGGINTTNDLINLVLTNGNIYGSTAEYHAGTGYGGWDKLRYTYRSTIRTELGDPTWVPDGGTSGGFLYGGSHYALGTGLDADPIVVTLNLGMVLNAQQFGCGTEIDSTSAAKALFAACGQYGVIYFPKQESSYLIREQLRNDNSNIVVYGDGKDVSDILIHPDGWVSGEAMMHIGDGVSTSYTSVRNLGIRATGGSLGNDLDALSIHSFYNCDIDSCRLQGGNYVTRETGGLRIVDGRHTRVHQCQLHNGYCHGIVVDEHLNGLNITGCAFDETSCAIKSLGNILEMNITGSNEFGSAVRNSLFPAPTDRRVIDLEIGSHGSIGVTGNIFSGGSETEFGMRWGFCSNMRIIANQLKGNKRFALCGAGTGRDVTIMANTFSGNGADVTDLDPANGLRDPDTTPFCSDIYLNTAFNYPTNISGNTSDLADRVMAWVEGTSTGFATSAFSCSANNSRFNDVAYVHQTTIKSTDVIQDSNFMLKGIAPVTGTITARTVTRGTPQVSTISVPGVVPGDLVTASVKNFGGLDYNLVLSVEVQGSNQVRWSLVNTSDSPIAITDTDILISAIRS